MIKKIIFSFLMVVGCISANAATTYYVRTDGGTFSQCTGRTDAAYPGTGTNQNCAWSSLFVAFPANGTARISGGDTVLVKRGSYKHGFGAPDTSLCNASDARNCYMSPVPPGPSAGNPTRILGEGWDKGCIRPPQLWGTERTDRVVNLVGSSNTQFQCFEITDHSSCAYDYVQTAYRCNKTTPPYGTYGLKGISTSDATNLFLKDLNIHGMAYGGISFGRMTDFSSENVRISGNPWVGLDGDIGTNTSGNTGTMSFKKLLIEWNGCLETYPAKKVFGCWGQSLGGYGDGVGIAASSGDWVFEDSTFRYNTSDGLDLLYVTYPGTVTLNRVWSEGNAGNQIKFSGGGSVKNSVIIGNCDFFNGKSFDIGTDNCRALGDAVVISPKPGQTAYFINNTVVGNGNISYYAGGTSASTHYIQNNIFYGYKSYVSSDRNLAGYYTDSNPVSIRDHNIWYNIHNATCTEGVGTVCVDPMLENPSMSNLNPKLKPGSPAVNAGIATNASTLDFYRVPRNARNGIDIGAVELK